MNKNYFSFIIDPYGCLYKFLKLWGHPLCPLYHRWRWRHALTFRVSRNGTRLFSGFTNLKTNIWLFWLKVNLKAIQKNIIMDSHMIYMMTKYYFTKESHTKNCFIFENGTQAVFRDLFLKYLINFWKWGLFGFWVSRLIVLKHKKQKFNDFSCSKSKKTRKR